MPTSCWWTSLINNLDPSNLLLQETERASSRHSLTGWEDLTASKLGRDHIGNFPIICINWKLTCKKESRSYSWTTWRALPGPRPPGRSGWSRGPPRCVRPVRSPLPRSLWVIMLSRMSAECHEVKTTSSTAKHCTRLAQIIFLQYWFQEQGWNASSCKQLWLWVLLKYYSVFKKRNFLISHFPFELQLRIFLSPIRDGATNRDWLRTVGIAGVPTQLRINVSGSGRKTEEVVEAAGVC